ncbi:MAG: hypothetical protein C5B59_03720 [Bacteroidetes bacterium]|nr:MAG: hypothetical protein C5B59_03720 [Bacteroidota bacterium]
MIMTIFKQKMKFFRLFIIIIFGIFGSFQQASSQIRREEEKDSVIWKMAETFTKYFNESDTAGMNLILSNDFMIQWMHESFLGRKNLFKAMLDTAFHPSFQFKLVQDANTVILYSDDHSAVCINASLILLNPVMASSLQSKNGYGECIMYFKDVSGNWMLKTVHLDLHCGLCGF